jgi:hypothetical protein
MQTVIRENYAIKRKVVWGEKLPRKEAFRRTFLGNKLSIKASAQCYNRFRELLFDIETFR